MSESAQELTRFGEVSIFNHGDGWKCNCSMFVTGAGVSVKIESERGHGDLESAARQCLDRCIDCIHDLKDKAPRLERS